MSGDLWLAWDPVTHSADLSIVENDLETDAGLQQAALLSLFLDRRAEAGDVLPEGEIDRRGWWADGTGVPDDKIGSRLWLLDRAKRTPENLARAEEYAREGLAWMIDDKAISKLEVLTEYQEFGLAIEPRFYRPNGDVVSFRFARTWAAQAERNS